MSQQIEVPETLLKKRKATDKAREERLASALAARKVSVFVIDCSCHIFVSSYDEGISYRFVASSTAMLLKFRD